MPLVERRPPQFRVDSKRSVTDVPMRRGKETDACRGDARRRCGWRLQ